jgi:hypothetical protein
MVKSLALLFLFLSSYTLAQTGAEEELLPVKVNGKIGFINSNGKVVIEPQFKEVGHFVDGLTPACIKKKFGYIDKTGKFIIPPIYDTARDFCEGYGIVVLGKKPQYIRPNGKLPFTLRYSYIAPFKNGFAQVHGTDKRVGIINRLGNVIIKPIYDDLREFSDGVTTARIYTTTYVIDTLGKTLFDLGDSLLLDEFDFHEGHALTSKLVASLTDSSKSDFIYGYLNKSGYYKPLYRRGGVFGTPLQMGGDIIISSKLPDSRSHGQSHLCFLDTNGNILWEDSLLNAFNLGGFHDGIAIAQYDKKELWLINNRAQVTHKIVDIPKGYSWGKAYTYLGRGRFIVTLHSRMKNCAGIIDTSGHILIPFEYPRIYPTKDPNWFVYRSTQDQKKEPDSLIFGTLNSQTGYVSKPFSASFIKDRSTAGSIFGSIGKQQVYFDHEGNIIWIEPENETLDITR